MSESEPERTTPEVLAEIRRCYKRPDAPFPKSPVSMGQPGVDSMGLPGVDYFIGFDPTVGSFFADSENKPLFDDPVAELSGSRDEKKNYLARSVDALRLRNRKPFGSVLSAALALSLAAVSFDIVRYYRSSSDRDAFKAEYNIAPTLIVNEREVGKGAVEDAIMAEWKLVEPHLLASGQLEHPTRLTKKQMYNIIHEASRRLPGPDFQAGEIAIPDFNQNGKIDYGNMRVLPPQQNPGMPGGWRNREDIAGRISRLQQEKAKDQTRRGWYAIRRG